MSQRDGYWFSRIQLNSQHPDAMEALRSAMPADAYQDHQWFWRAFFPAESGAERDYLFRRAEPVEAGEPPIFYTVSKRPPRQQSNAAWRVDTREYNPRVETGQTLLFELRANPTKSVSVRDGARPGEGRDKTDRGQRHDVVMHAKKVLLRQRELLHWRDWKTADRPDLYSLVQTSCAEWLQQQAQRHGFSVLTEGEVLKVDGYRRQELHGNSRSRRVVDAPKGIVLSTVDFTGALRIEDVGRFTKALVQGVGHGKAFGCGLLLVRRA